MTHDSPSITREQAARILGTSERHVRRLIQQGRLPLESDAHGAQVLREQAVLDLAAQSREVVTQIEAANRLGCGRRTIRRMLDDGRLQGVATPGGHDRVTLESINARLGDVPSEPDIIGHKEANVSHRTETAIRGVTDKPADISGHDPPGQLAPSRVAPGEAVPDAEDLVQLLDEAWPTMSAPRPDVPGREGGEARRVRRFAVLIAAVVALVAAGVSLFVLVSTTPGSDPAMRAFPVSPSTHVKVQARNHRLHRSVPSPRATTPPARGGPATLVAQPVPRTQRSQPAPTRTRSDGRRTAPPAATPSVTQRPAARTRCGLFLHGGLC